MHPPHRRSAVIVAAALFGGLALLTALVSIVTLRHALLEPVDDAARHAIRSIRPEPLVDAAKVLATIGGGWWAVGVRVAVATVIAARRLWRGVAAFAGACASTSLATDLLKTAVDRSRPAGHLVHAGDASFPSGHTSAAAAIAFAAVLVLVARSSRPWMAVAVASTVVMGLSRMVLDVHWLTDTIAGGLLGAAMAFAWVAAIHAERAATSARRP